MRRLAVLGISGVFLLLGALFVVSPEPAAGLFGIPADAAARPYIRAIGFRDLALACYLIGLVMTSNWPGLRMVIGASVLIPLCDIALVLAQSGPPAFGNLLLHAVSAVVLVALFAWFRLGDAKGDPGA